MQVDNSNVDRAVALRVPEKTKQQISWTLAVFQSWCEVREEPRVLWPRTQSSYSDCSATLFRSMSAEWRAITSKNSLIFGFWDLAIPVQEWETQDCNVQPS